MSVLTDAEGDCLDEMAQGLVSRYEQSHIEPPKVLYVDRDCCGIRLAQQFTGWPNLLVKPDIWHFIRRFAMACCSESHALYGTFMGQISGCIFEWDPVDLEMLLGAKKEELKATGVYRATQDDIAMHLTKELATHCKRRTRGTDESAKLIKRLLTTYSSDPGKDTMGIPLLNCDYAWQIWEEQKKTSSVHPRPRGRSAVHGDGETEEGWCRSSSLQVWISQK